MPPADLDRAFIQDLIRKTEEVEQHIVEHPKTGLLMVLIPAGKFLIAGSGSPFEVDLPAYYVSVHPVTNAQYARFVAETGHRVPELPTYSTHRESVWKNGQFPLEKANHPVTDVSWKDANAYCRWAELRLPTELEWLKTACGLDGRAYPWGKKMDPSRCHIHGNEGKDKTADVWCYGQGGAPFGGLQHHGNVAEWCADCHEEWYDFYDTDLVTRFRRGHLSGPSSGASRVTRNGCAKSRGSYSAVLGSDRIGFRCMRGVGAYP